MICPRKDASSRIEEPKTALELRYANAKLRCAKAKLRCANAKLRCAKAKQAIGFRCALRQR